MLGDLLRLPLGFSLASLSCVEFLHRLSIVTLQYMSLPALRAVNMKLPFQHSSMSYCVGALSLSLGCILSSNPEVILKLTNLFFHISR